VKKGVYLKKNRAAGREGDRADDVSDLGRAAVQNAEGYRGKNHYHILNPNSTSKHDYYLDKYGNPVPKNSKQSHIIP